MGVGQRAVIYGDDTGVSGDDAGIAFISSFGQGAPAFVSAKKLGPNNPKVRRHDRSEQSLFGCDYETLSSEASVAYTHTCMSAAVVCALGYYSCVTL
jgi:hypothetical protein